jgi:CHAT domain-containing protein
MRALVTFVILMLFAVPAGANPEIAKLEQQLAAHPTDAFARVKILKKLYALQKQLTGDDVYTWRRKIDLASTLQQIGEYAQAAVLFEELVVTAEKQHGAESEDVKRALENLRGVYEMRREHAKVDRIQLRVLALSKKLYGETSVRHADDLDRYGSYLWGRGEVVAAQRVYEQSLRIQEAAKDPTLHRALSMLGTLYWLTKQQSKAVVMFDRYIALTKAQGMTQYVHTILWVSEHYRYGGRPDLVARLAKQGIAVAEAELARLDAAKTTGYELTSILFSLAELYKHAADHAKAEQILLRHIAHEEKQPQGFPPYAQLAALRREQGRTKEALAAFEKAKAWMGRISKTNNSGMNSMIADLLVELGDPKRAETLYLEAQADLDKLFGKRAMLVTRLHLGLVGVYVASKQLDKAERVLAENLDIVERELSTILAAGTEADHLAYFGRETHQLETALAFHKLAPNRVSAAKLALTTLLRRKGRVLDAAAGSLATVRAKLSPEDRKLLDQLDDARAKLAKLVVAGPQMTADYAKQIAELEDQIRGLEVTLARKNAQYRVASQPVELAAVQQKIPKTARLVEIVNYEARAFNVPFHKRPKDPPRHYAAYVVGDRGAPVLVELGPAKPIDEAVAKFRDAVKDPDNDNVDALGKALHDLTFGKLVRALGPAKHVMLAPDGALNLVPFAALSDGKQYLIAKYQFTYLTSGRDLLRLGIRGKPKAGALIFADPSFDSTTASQPKSGRRARALNQQWAPLPGTGQEADAIARSLAAKVYRDKQATESELKAVVAPRILHLATHGFFLADEGDGDKVGGVENPLLRSGLALAGANKLASGNEDGILTALEASGLDLWGTRLVVLSACETGVGKVSNGDGVYGLRRALVIAGAESLVMTLWQVDDLATRDLMSGYYKKLVAGGGRSAALREIQLELQKQPKYAHPYFWASFVPAGDSGPLE